MVVAIICEEEGSNIVLLCSEIKRLNVLCFVVVAVAVIVFCKFFCRNTPSELMWLDVCSGIGVGGDGGGTCGWALVKNMCVGLAWFQMWRWIATVLVKWILSVSRCVLSKSLDGGRRKPQKTLS